MYEMTDPELNQFLKNLARLIIDKFTLTLKPSNTKHPQSFRQHKADPKGLGVFLHI